MQPCRCLTDIVDCQCKHPHTAVLCAAITQKTMRGVVLRPREKDCPPLPAAAAAGGVPPPPPAAAGRSSGVVTTARAVHHTPSTPAMAGTLLTHRTPRWRAYPAHHCPVPHPPAPCGSHRPGGYSSPLYSAPLQALFWRWLGAMAVVTTPLEVHAAAVAPVLHPN